MSKKFTINLDTARFDTRVSFLPRLVGCDFSPITKPYEDIVNDFLNNALYGVDVADGRKIKDANALQEFKNNRPAIIAQCIVKNGVDKENVVLVNNIVKVDIDLKSAALVEVVFPVVKMLFGQFVLAIYRTVSGNGLQVDVLIDDPEKKAIRYNEITSILKSHQIPVDDCFKNVVQKSVLSYDANGYFNSKPEPFTGAIDPMIETQVRELTGRNKKSKKDDEEDKDSPKKRSIPFIIQNYGLKRNLMTNDVERDGRSVGDIDLHSITVDCVDNKMNIDKQWTATVVGSDRVPAYHPLNEFIKKYSGREFEGSLKRVVDSIVCLTGADLDFPYFETYFSKWWVKLIAQVYEPDVANELFPCLMGPPGIGKTFFLTNLLPDELKGYQALLQTEKSKDAAIDLTVNLLLIDDEYKSRHHDDETHMKSVLTNTKIKVRRPFEQKTSALKRIASLCGNSNSTTILKDDNRRLIPIEVSKIDWGLFNSVSKIDLFLEGYSLFRKGFDYNLTVKETAALQQVSMNYEVTNTEEETVLLFFPKAHSVEAADEFLTVSQMISLASTYGGGTRLTPYRVTAILNRHGYPQKTITVHSSRTGEKTSRLRGWGVKQVDFTNIAQLFVAKDMTARKYINLD